MFGVSWSKHGGNIAFLIELVTTYISWLAVINDDSAVRLREP